MLTDRPQGATAKTKDGRIEIFITRKTLKTDFGGMGGKVNKAQELSLNFKLLLNESLNIK